MIAGLEAEGVMMMMMMMMMMSGRGKQVDRELLVCLLGKFQVGVTQC